MAQHGRRMATIISAHMADLSPKGDIEHGMLPVLEPGGTPDRPPATTRGGVISGLFVTRPAPRVDITLGAWLAPMRGSAVLRSTRP